MRLLIIAVALLGFTALMRLQVMLINAQVMDSLAMSIVFIFVYTFWLNITVWMWRENTRLQPKPMATRRRMAKSAPDMLP